MAKTHGKIKIAVWIYIIYADLYIFIFFKCAPHNAISYGNQITTEHHTAQCVSAATTAAAAEQHDE